MNRIKAPWRNGFFKNMDDHPVHTTPYHHPTKMDFLTKTFLQIVHAARWLVQHSSSSTISTSHNQQGRPLPSLLYLSFFYDTDEAKDISGKLLILFIIMLFVWPDASLIGRIFQFMCTAVHVIFSFGVSFTLLFFLYLILGIPSCLRDAIVKKIESKRARMRKKKRELHELPSTKMLKIRERISLTLMSSLPSAGWLRTVCRLWTACLLCGRGRGVIHAKPKMFFAPNPTQFIK